MIQQQGVKHTPFALVRVGAFGASIFQKSIEIRKHRASDCSLVRLLSNMTLSAASRQALSMARHIDSDIELIIKRQLTHMSIAHESATSEGVPVPTCRMTNEL
eukprot:3876547-Amphidinium_carterae.1